MLYHPMSLEAVSDVMIGGRLSIHSTAHRHPHRPNANCNEVGGMCQYVSYPHLNRMPDADRRLRSDLPSESGYRVRSLLPVRRQQ